MVDPTINSQNITYKYSYISTEKQAPAYNLNTPLPRQQDQYVGFNWTQDWRVVRMDGKNTTSESAYLQVNYFLECAEGYKFITGMCIPDICITDATLNIVCYDDLKTYYC